LVLVLLGLKLHQCLFITPSVVFDTLRLWTEKQCYDEQPLRKQAGSNFAKTSRDYLLDLWHWTRAKTF